MEKGPPRQLEKEYCQKMKIDSKKPKAKTCKNCRWKCCEKFTDEDRNNLCKVYNMLESYNRKKDFLLGNTDVQVKQRERVRGGISHRKKDRTYSVVYSFVQHGQRTRVCKDFFLCQHLLLDIAQLLKLSEAVVSQDILREMTDVADIVLQIRQRKLISGWSGNTLTFFPKSTIALHKTIFSPTVSWFNSDNTENV